VAGGDQPGDDPATEHTGGAGDQDLHENLHIEWSPVLTIRHPVV